MDTVTLDLMPAEKKSRTSSHRSPHSTLIFAAVTILGLAAIVGLCAAAVVLVPRATARGRAPATISTGTETDDSILEDEYSVAADHGDDNNIGGLSIARRQFPSIRSPHKDLCTSEITNDSVPMARIEGKNRTWGIAVRERGYFSHFFKTKYHCDGGEAFVSGGMNFSVIDQRLYFPVCGFYYISSQVMFQFIESENTAENRMLDARHQIEVRSNCESSQTATRNLNSFAGIREREHAKGSSYIGDVIKVCTGGSIKVLIPSNHNRCCAYGDRHSTHLSVFLIREASC